jgi:very-short-patch-repair endonuclease
MTATAPSPAAGANRIEALLAQARTRLIETGTRNRLVHTNRRAKRPSTLAVVGAQTDDLWERLVTLGGAMRFRADPRIRPRGEGDAEEAAEPEDPPPAAGPDVLQTRVGEEALQKRLLKFYRDAKTLEDEQGINILYLAVGFLRWYEDEKSEVAREAPLILVPVTLVRDVRRSTFELKAREEDITLNLPLAERLKTDFGITLPDLDTDAEGFRPSLYFDAVAEAVAVKRRWSVDRAGVDLGLFSFAKLLMFHDLSGAAWPDGAILEHPLLRGLLADGFAGEEPLFPPETRIDERFAPADLVHVVDADGSQTLVIETVRAGRNLVVQGPPGTGKSQTIANIIAGAVHDGKTVLFVAEKMVALEVVHARLDRAGLGPVCLELHSRSANKRALAEELRRTLEGAAATPRAEADAARLQEVRDRLNALTHRLHALIGDTGMTPYRALGDLVRAAGMGLPPAEIDLSGAVSWSPAAYEALREGTERLARATRGAGAMGANPWRGVGNLDLQPTDLARLKDQFLRLAQSLETLRGQVADQAAALRRPVPATLTDVRALAALLRVVATAPLDQIPVLRVLAGLSAADRALLREIVGRGMDAVAAIAAVGERFRPAALEADPGGVRSGLARGVGAWFPWLSGSYRRASAELATWLVEPLPATAAERLACADALVDLRARRRALAEDATAAVALIGPLWTGERTDFAALNRVAAWLDEAQAAGVGEGLGPALQVAAAGGAEEAATRLAFASDAVAQVLATLFSTLALDCPTAFGVAGPEAIPLEEANARLAAWAAPGDSYAAFADLARCDAELRAAGLAALADRLADGRLDPERAGEELRHARAEALWKAAIKAAPDLARIDGTARGALVEEFRRLDVARRRAVAAAIRARHAERMPSGAMGEMGVIRHQIGLKRGHMAIRGLIQRAGRALQGIKPVFMMSPISVAQYLAPGAVSFDLVVIDEASQVRPEDALGVLARGGQVAVVGDRKQLPPTSFFARLLDDDAGEDDEEAEAGAAPGKVGDLESILTLCEARGLPSRMLRWHYRSRHPSLIEVSDAEFYGGLFMPPSPAADRDAEGLVVRRVAGAYDRGGKRHNAIEAAAIVEAAARHAEVTPGRSLGIVTFSTAQRDLVSNLLDERRRTDPVLDAFITAKASGEEVFVKNLENVQGDERDVVMISVGYGPRQAGGRLDSMNFGPVTTEGGERRLNVLFTRARFRCEVFVSFEAGDIDLARATGEGPRVLKRFLAYAETGVLDQATPTGRDHDSPFEADVAGVIAGLGYEVDPQVGSAGFRIDLAVRDPERPGRYLMAVECDGATYHGALWARERDRLRQEILEGLGWRFHRVWSTDWFYRREAEIARLRDALQAARAGDPAPAPEPVADVTPEPVTEEPAAPPTPLRPPYVTATFAIPKGVEPQDVPVQAMALLVRRIVDIEGPVHADEVARRVATLFGKERAGSRIAQATALGLAAARRSDPTLTEEDGFWWNAAQAEAPPVRDRSSVTGPLLRADMLPPLEIRAAAVQALRENGTLSADEMPTAIARLLGFQRAGTEMRQAIGRVMERMVADGVVRQDDKRIGPTQ